ncbi:MAG: hypothetical protein WDW36_007377 [Sanguina aurantia]
MLSPPTQIASDAKRVAVLGIKTEKQAGQPAFEVAAYLQRDGVEVVPVPVFYPDVQEILGVPVYRRLKDVPGRIDILNVFRKPQDVAAHLEEILGVADRVGCVWLQSGITEPASEEALARAGVLVVSDMCLMVERRTCKL